MHCLERALVFVLSVLILSPLELFFLHVFSMFVCYYLPFMYESRLSKTTPIQSRRTLVVSIHQ